MKKIVIRFFYRTFPLKEKIWKMHKYKKSVEYFKAQNWQIGICCRWINGTKRLSKENQIFFFFLLYFDRCAMISGSLLMEDECWKSN